MMTPGLMTSVVEPPVPGSLLSLADAKIHLKLLHDAEDSEILAGIGVAEAYAESMTGASLRVQTLDGALPGFPAGTEINLPWPPLIEVVSVTYRDPYGASVVLPASTYVAVKRRGVARIVLVNGQSWPDTDLHPEAVVVRWRCGYRQDVPAEAAETVNARHAVRLLLGHWYYSREATDERGRVSSGSHNVDALLGGYQTKGWL